MQSRSIVWYGVKPTDEGAVVTLDVLYERYRGGCGSARQAVSCGKFNDWLGTIGRDVALKVKKQGGQLVCQGVKLAA